VEVILQFGIYLFVALIGFVMGNFFKAPLLIAVSAIFTITVSIKGLLDGGSFDYIFQSTILGLIIMQVMYILGLFTGSRRRRSKDIN